MKTRKELLLECLDERIDTVGDCLAHAEYYGGFQSRNSKEWAEELEALQLLRLEVANEH